jgi:2-(1,2-epoxy-1,2-dihydrophenyl)acetyl-CoA isomerase
MSTILFEIKDAVAHIQLNRPEKYNAFNREMSLELQQALDKCKNDNSIRCVLLYGAGKGFSAGQDLEEAVTSADTDVSKILTEQLNPIITRIRKLEKPVVAAVSGVAAGAGANVALCCDIVVASRSAFFVQAFSKIGLIPDSGGTFFLPRLIGWQKASALMMLAEKVNADDAQQMGMIYKVFADETFLDEAGKLANTLAQMPTKGLALTKLALNQSALGSFEEQLHDEELLQQRAAKTSDFKEGVAAFLEKRKPTFKGE